MVVFAKHTKWAIAAACSWSIFLIFLFLGIIPKTSLIQEYDCTVKDFNVDPRFECSTKCPIIPDEMILLQTIYNIERQTLDDYFYSYYSNNPNQDHEPHHPHCDDLEKDTLNWYSPKLCLHARWGFEDPLCPPEYEICYSGHKWLRRCNLSCPLAYNVTVDFEVDTLGHVSINRDLGTDSERYNSYKNEYIVDKHMTCQVMKNGNGEVKWIDERISHQAMVWWKWTLFIGSILLAIICTSAAGIYYAKFRHGYTLLSDDGDDTEGGGLLGAGVGNERNIVGNFGRTGTVGN